MSSNRTYSIWGGGINPLPCVLSPCDPKGPKYDFPQFGLLTLTNNFCFLSFALFCLLHTCPWGWGRGWAGGSGVGGWMVER